MARVTRSSLLGGGVSKALIDVTTGPSRVQTTMLSLVAPSRPSKGGQQIATPRRTIERTNQDRQIGRGYVRSEIIPRKEQQHSTALLSFILFFTAANCFLRTAHTKNAPPSKLRAPRTFYYRAVIITSLRQQTAVRGPLCAAHDNYRVPPALHCIHGGVRRLVPPLPTSPKLCAVCLKRTVVDESNYRTRTCCGRVAPVQDPRYPAPGTSRSVSSMKIDERKGLLNPTREEQNRRVLS